MGDTTYGESYTYDADDGALTYIEGSGELPSIAFGYDALKRLSYRFNYYFRQDYTYRDISSGSQTTTQVASIAYSQRPGGTNFSTVTLGYSYDSLGNISKVTGTNNTAQNASYTYDQQGQLITETNNKGLYTYNYDTYGNIRSVSGAESHTYAYGNSEWLDLLTAYDSHAINYDTIGNPTNWYNTKAWNFTWQNGRQLAKATSGSNTVSYTYDVAGIRDSKTVGSTVYNYLTQNGKVVCQTWGSHTLDIIYDNQGNPSCCIYDGTKYIYVLNLQGDVIGLVNSATLYAMSFTSTISGTITDNRDVYNENLRKAKFYITYQETRDNTEKHTIQCGEKYIRCLPAKKQLAYSVVNSIPTFSIEDLVGGDAQIYELSAMDNGYEHEGLWGFARALFQDATMEKPLYGDSTEDHYAILEGFELAEQRTAVPTMVTDLAIDEAISIVEYMKELDSKNT